MIAIVTSTVKPELKNENTKSYYSFNQRLEQTKLTLTGLQKCGFTSIFLIDNSPTLNQFELEQLLFNFSKIQLHHIQQYQFNNKGINELLMLLYITQHLPLNQIIFKLSGRYHPTSAFKKPDFFDFAAKGYQYNKRNGTISTRGYWIKNSEVLHRFLLGCLSEIFAYPKRITGIRSFYYKLKDIFFNKHATPLNISIEFAAANVLKKENYNLKLLNNIGIEGFVAGSDHEEKIIE